MDLKNDDAIMQNLKDAACSSDFIEKFFKLKANGNKKTLVQLLYKHKSELLDNLHSFQKKIACLDYLIFEINNSNKKN